MRHPITYLSLLLALMACAGVAFRNGAVAQQPNNSDCAGVGNCAWPCTESPDPCAYNADSYIVTGYNVNYCTPAYNKYCVNNHWQLCGEWQAYDDTWWPGNCNDAVCTSRDIMYYGCQVQ